MRVDILTLFPALFDAYFKESIPRIACEKGICRTHIHNIRDHAIDKRGSVDEKPYGGGPGMVLRVDVVVPAVEHVVALDARRPGIILLTAQGEPYSQGLAEELAGRDRLLLVCGHYEGFDARIAPLLHAREISIGDYVLSGGEVAALVLLDSLIRLLPGVLGDARSIESESFSTGLLEYPHYTRPLEYHGLRVPDVLRSGDHAKIATWRSAQAESLTRRRRPDMLGESSARISKGSR